MRTKTRWEEKNGIANGPAHVDWYEAEAYCQWLLKYEPRVESLAITLLPQTRSGHLEYTLEAHLKDVGLVRYGTEFAPEGKVLVRHLKQQQFVSA